LIRELVPAGGRVLDPFAGSGVVLSEASRAGYAADGFDVNPIAVLLSAVTLDPPDPEEFAQTAHETLARFARRCGSAFRSSDGTQARYVVHETQVPCPTCSTVVGGRESRRAPRGYACPHCGTRLSFSLRHLVSTRVIEVVSAEATVEPALLAEQQARSCKPSLRPAAGFTFPFAENRRTLAHRGLQTRDLFTPRNFALLTLLAEEIHGLPSGRSRDALLLMLSASVAQCSRLIAYRSGMTSGGPAWSVPGFWVPPVHVETNPAVHLRARLAKFVRGVARLHDRPRTARATVSQADATDALTDLAGKGTRYDLIFLDPPYGNNVPYVEFSTLYNSFLRRAPDPALDISVSDRRQTIDPWADYEQRLGRVLEQTRGVLESEGQLLVTFNNHDDRAWKALMSGLQRADYWCTRLMYQLPAVVSAKAQFSPEGSYIGDFVATFAARAEHARRTRSTDAVTKALIRGAAARGGTIPHNVAKRIAIGAFVEHNLHIDVLDAALRRLAEMFGAPSEGFLTLAAGTLRPRRTPSLAQTARAVAASMSEARNFSWRDLFEAVCQRCVDIGIPEPAEVVQALAPDYVVSGKTWSPARARRKPKPALALSA
jgi:16S rRNA G966 N2-methylase RsmD/DNA-directed RNA polymerase subunit RPC12/RpoP